MQKLAKSFVAVFAAVIPLMAGALYLEIADPASNAEATAQHAVLVVRTAACKSPEKTIIRGVAEGTVDGAQKTVPLKLIALPTPGTYALKREWPLNGNWTIKVVATNADYQNYATSLLVPFENGSMQLSDAKHLSGKPTDPEILAMLGSETTGARSSLH